MNALRVLLFLALMTAGRPGPDASLLADEELPAGAVLKISGGGTPDAPEPLDSLREIVFSPDGRWLAFRGEPGDPAAARRIHLWDVSKRTAVRTISGMAQPCVGVSFSPDSKSLLACTADAPAGLQLWSVPEGKPLTALSSGRGRAVFLLGQGLLASIHSLGKNEFIAWRQPATGAETQRFVMPLTFLAEISPDGQTLAATARFNDSTVRLIDVATGRVMRRMTGGSRQPTSLRFSRSGRTIAAAFSDEGVILWEAATGERVAQWKPGSPVLAVAFSADESFLAAACGDGSVRLIACTQPADVRILKGHGKPASAVVFSGDGRWLATGSFDPSVVLWDFPTILGEVPRIEPPRGEELVTLWDDLAASSAGTAYRAIERVKRTSGSTLPQVFERVQKQLLPPEKALIEQWIRELDDPDSIVRQRATDELKKLRELARPVLARVAKESASAEVRMRARRILGWADRTPRFSAADARRLLRVLHAVEPFPSPEATTIVLLIVQEFPDPQVKREAERLLRNWKSEPRAKG